jgi:tetratricopeptide (TPR) repeat protein
MTEPEEASNRPGLNKAHLLSRFLEAGGVFVCAAAVLWAIDEFWVVSQQERPSVRVFLTAVGLLAAGLGGALLLWGLAKILRQLDALPSMLEQRPPMPPRPTPPESAPLRTAEPAHAPTADAATLTELVTLMREVRDISLLNDEERALRLEVQGKEALRRVEQKVPTLLREHGWVEARRLVQEARERFPSFSQWDALEEQIEKVRSEVEAHDVEAATRQVNDLAALGAWPRVMDVVNELLERHPTSGRAAELAKRVRFEREKAEAEQRARLMAQAQEASSRHDWTTALQVANTILQRFPHSPEAAALQPQIATLRENVEIEIRKRMEADIRELIKQHRYDEALRIAREVVEQYPESPQADALRDQLPRLEERAATMS